MKAVATLPVSTRPSSTPCPDRVEVLPGDRFVTAATVKAWIDHLRSHGWTDDDILPIWLTRSRMGVTR